MQALIVNVLLTYELWDNHTAHCRFCNGHVRSLQTLYNAIVQPPARCLSAREGNDFIYIMSY